jgi:hypothetical protein
LTLQKEQHKSSLELQREQHKSGLELQRQQNSNVVEFSKLQHIQKLSVEQISTLEKFLPHLTSSNEFLRAASLEVILFLENEQLIWRVLSVVLGTRGEKSESAAVKAQKQLVAGNFDLQNAIVEAKSIASTSRKLSK